MISDMKINEENLESVADVLGMSGLLVYDMTHRRVADYKFDWNRALSLVGDTGSALQYSHARLCRFAVNDCLISIFYDFDVFQFGIQLWF